MLELRSELTKLLKTYNSQVYFQKAPNTATFPYVTYNFLDSFTNGDQEVIPMDVDIWDNKEDTTELEMITSSIWRGLKSYDYIDENIQFVIYQETRITELDEEDNNIRRRTLTFYIKFFYRG